MSDWATGYRRALADVEHLADTRGLTTPALLALFRDMQRDADVIEHEEDNALKKRRLAAAREAFRGAGTLPLFAATPGGDP